MAATVGLTGCWSSGSRTDPATANGADTTHTLYERRLLGVIDDLDALDAAAAVAEDADFPEVERQFHNLANRFNSIIADNPKQVEVRLIYAKLLDRFGDQEGARDQCVEVLKLDPTIAVAHQMLGTYFAETGDHSRALAYYLTAIEHAPEEAVYHFGLGDLLYTFKPGFLEDGIFDADTLDAKMLEAFRRAAELAPDNLPYQFRYGEAFYDLAEVDWTVPLAHWRSLGERTDLTLLQHDAARLHAARCLGELERYAEARVLAHRITSQGLFASRDALLDAIDEAEGREGE